MNEQEKARELVERFYKATVSVESIGDKSSAKQCALICVEEFLTEYDTKILSGRPSHLEARKAYWQNVKSEIEKL